MCLSRRITYPHLLPRSLGVVRWASQGALRGHTHTWHSRQNHLAQPWEDLFGLRWPFLRPKTTDQHLAHNLYWSSSSYMFPGILIHVLVFTEVLFFLWKSSSTQLVHDPNFNVSSSFQYRCIKGVSPFKRLVSEPWPPPPLPPFSSRVELCFDKHVMNLCSLNMSTTSAYCLCDLYLWAGCLRRWERGSLPSGRLSGVVRGSHQHVAESQSEVHCFCREAHTESDKMIVS